MRGSSEKTGGRKAALNVNRHLEFFQQIEHQWSDIPDYARLLQYFGAAGLGRHLTARCWMEESGLITVDRAARETDSDRRRIEATLGRLPGRLGRRATCSRSTTTGCACA